MLGRQTLAVAAIVAMTAAMGCETIQEHKTAQGALIGTAAGAGLGAIIGEAASGDAAEGALIGAVAGGLLGTGIGYYLEKQEKELQQVPGAQVQQTTYQGQQALAVTMNSQVLFAHNSPQLLPNAQYALADLARVIMDPQYPPPRAIMITGHTDSTGDYNYNVQLSLYRAQAVQQYLVSRGINPALLSIQGAGPNVPIADNSTPEGQAMNRRVELLIIPSG
jgi:outer membrane protein OmpA-like peptidoglycan-associated protein